MTKMRSRTSPLLLGPDLFRGHFRSGHILLRLRARPWCTLADGGELEVERWRGGQVERRVGEVKGWKGREVDIWTG